MTSPDFPRILIVTSNNFNRVTGGGITLTNLFRGWPADRIANLHQDPTPEDHSVCQTSYRLSEEEIRWAWPFSLVRGLHRQAALTLGGDESIGGAESPLPAGGADREMIWVQLARRTLGDGVPRTVRITKRLDQWLRSFQPQILYGSLGSMAQIRLMRKLAQTLGVPVVVHIMDDWPAVLYRRGLLGPLFRSVMEREFQTVLRDASLRLGICGEMCEEYQKRYGVSFVPFHNALDMDVWLPQAKRDWTAGSPFIVRYVGSIVPDGQREALRDVCDAVAGLRASGRSIEMWVHAPGKQVAYLQDGRSSRGGLRLLDPPSPDRIVEVLAGADLLALPFNFDARSVQYIRLSMPTKVPAYMASGTPVLVYGPPGIAAVRNAERDGWGYVVSSPGIPPLLEALVRLMDDQASRESMGRRAQVLARQRYDAAKIRPTFHKVLGAALTRPGRTHDDPIK